MASQRRQRSLFATPANIYLMLGLVIGMALLHITWLPLMTNRPDLMLVLIVAWSLLRGAEEGMVWAFVGGTLLDLLSGGPFGAFTLALLVAAWLAGAVQRAAFGATVLQVVVVAAVSFVYHLIYVVSLATSVYSINWATVTRLMGPAILWNIPVFLALYRIITWLHRR